MRRRLNGWQRIGVVATCLWFAYVLGVAATDRRAFREGGYISAFQCLEPAPPKHAGEPFTFDEGLGCAEGKLVPGRHVPETFDWAKFLFALFGPALGGWLVAYVLVALVRWIAAGFRREG